MKPFVHFFTVLFLGLSISMYGQATTETNLQKVDIEGLHIYPNPVRNGKLFITTQNNHSKAVEIFDVLGKRIIAASILGNELNISRLSPGIYIIKITENNITAVRKLIVK